MYAHAHTHSDKILQVRDALPPALAARHGRPYRTRTRARLHERALCTRTARARTYSVPGTRPSGFDLEPAERVPSVKQGARSSCLFFLNRPKRVSLVKQGARSTCLLFLDA